MKAVVFSACVDPAVQALLANELKALDFSGCTVQYVLADEVSIGMPFTALSLPGVGLRLDVQTHGIAAVLSGPKMSAMGFATGD